VSRASDKPNSPGIALCEGGPEALIGVASRSRYAATGARRTALGVILLLVTTSMCAGSPAPTRVLTDADAGAHIQVDVRTTLLIRLSARLGTGYSWQVAQRDAACLAEGAPAGVERSPSQPPGAPEYQVFTFQPIKACLTHLELDYARSWEKTAKPAKVFAIDIEITKKEDGS
jgi:predicted secreted protein